MELTQTPFEPGSTRTLHLELTTRCNAACPQCARMDPSTGYAKDHELRLPQIQEMISPSFVQQLDKMFACGNFGDPAAARDCLPIYEWFRSANRNITLGMNTNGGLRTRFWWQDLAGIMSNKLDYVVFSIDGLEDTNHLYRRNVQWDLLMTNVEYYIAAGGVAHWDMLVFEHNQHQVDACRELARSMGFRRFRTKVSSRFTERPVAFLSPPLGYQSNAPGVGNIRCHAAEERSLYISANGRILPCCFIGADVFRLSDDMERYIQQPGYSDLVNSWISQPPAVCQHNCSQQHQGTRFHNQWQEDLSLIHI